MSEQGAPAPLQEIWHARCPVPTPLNLAIQLGWVERALQRHGVQLHSTPEHSDPTRFEQYYESAHPNSFRQGGSVPALYARSNGLGTRVIGLSWTDEYQAVIALPQSGLTGVRQLRGRKIGIPLHDTPIDHSRVAALRGFSALLAVEGLSLRDVEVVDLPDHPVPTVTRDGMVIATGSGRRGRNRYTSEVHALARGSVDAIYVKDPSGAQATHLLGAAVIGNIGSHPEPWVRINNCTPRPLTISQFLLDRYPEVVRELLVQVVLAGNWAASHAQETVGMIARETASSESWVRYAYGDLVHDRLRLSLDAGWVAALSTFHDFMAAQRFLVAPFDVAGWVDPAPLEDALKSLSRHSGGRYAADAPVPTVSPDGSRVYH